MARMIDRVYGHTTLNAPDLFRMIDRDRGPREDSAQSSGDHLSCLMPEKKFKGKMNIEQESARFTKAKVHT